jgi:hypothetical protein
MVYLVSAAKVKNAFIYDQRAEDGRGRIGILVI